MKIKTKLQLIIIVNILILVGIVSVSLLWQKKADRQFKQQALVMELHQAIFERARLTEEYFLYREDRSKEQFLLIHKQIGGLVKRMSGTFTGLEEKVFLNNMTGFHTKIGGFFDQLVRLDQSAAVHTATTQALRERIISQMLVNAHFVYREGLRLLNAANEKTVYQNNLAHLYSNIFFGLLTSVIVLFAVIIIRTERKLRESAEWLATTLRSIGDGVIATDTRGCITFMNPVSEALTGWRGEEALGRLVGEVFNIVNGETGERDEDPVARGLREGAVVGLANSTVLIGKDGTKRAIDDSGAPIKDDKGKIIGTILVFHDITERKRAGEALRKTKQELEMIFDSVPALIWQKDREGAYLQVNKAYCDTVGLSQESIFGKTDYDLFPQVIADRYVSDDRKILNSGTAEFGIEEGHQKPSGELAWIRTDKLVYYDMNGNIAGTIGFAVDITARKRVEEALQDSLAEKEVLLREVHHRVKNSLAAVIGLLALQRQVIDNSTVTAALEDLSGRIKAMALVHEKLYRSENLSRIAIQGYLKALISHLCTSFGSRGNIRCTIVADGIEMDLDTAVPCGMIVNELITNSLKHGFPGDKPRPGASHCELTVSMEWDGTTYTLVVADNGVGVPADLDWVATKSLGLRLVRMLGQHQLQGHIELDRTNGTRFTLTFGSRHRR